MKLLQIDGVGRVVNEWQSPSQAAKELNLDPSHIGKCLREERNTHGGYRWKWEEGSVDIETNLDKTVESKSFDYRENSAVLTAKTEKSITSLDEAIEFFEIDTDVWEVDRFVVNSWDVTSNDTGKRTNYQVKVFLKRKETDLKESLLLINDILKDYSPKPLRYTEDFERDTIVVSLADFHIGAEISNLPRTLDFNVNIVADYMKACSEEINKYGAKNVVINMHGDFFESLSGLNHENTFKSLGKGMWGAEVIILANEMIGGQLLSKINNIRSINIVGGNHDRMTPSNKIDNTGEGAKLLAYMLQKDFPEIPIEFNSLILVKEIDGIVYIMLHGDKSISRKDASKVIFDYGDSSKFNLLTEGHLHTRATIKTIKKTVARYETYEAISMDEMKYRKVKLPSLFTGNFFSESLGYAATAGMIITENAGKGIPNVYDLSI